MLVRKSSYTHHFHNIIDSNIFHIHSRLTQWWQSLIIFEGIISKPSALSQPSVRINFLTITTIAQNTSNAVPYFSDEVPLNSSRGRIMKIHRWENAMRNRWANGRRQHGRVFTHAASRCRFHLSCGRLWHIAGIRNVNGWQPTDGDHWVSIFTVCNTTIFQCLLENV